jgi:gamma-glutamyl-gamma-aminobutyrate hydrolase PuuD
MSAPTLKIGVSARILHPQAGAKGLQSKTLQYLEQTAAHWLMSRNVLVLMVPTVDTGGLLHRSEIRLADYARHLDGLMLQGGADVCPMTYGEDPLAREWAGDRLRDEYEIELLHEFIGAGKPVLGVCRGAQLINVAYGGTLYQDITRQVPEARKHVTDAYEKNLHEVRFEAGGGLARRFTGVGEERRDLVDIDGRGGNDDLDPVGHCEDRAKTGSDRLDHMRPGPGPVPMPVLRFISRRSRLRASRVFRFFLTEGFS